MSRDGGRQLLVLARGEKARDDKVFGAAVAPREASAGDFLDEALHEAVLTPFGRTRVGVEDEELLAHEVAKIRVELDPLHALDGSQGVGGERRAEDGGVLEEGPFLGGQGVEARADERVERLGQLEGGHVATDRVATVLLGERPTVEQRPHHLDGIEGHAFRAC